MKCFRSLAEWLYYTYKESVSVVKYRIMLLSLPKEERVVLIAIDRAFKRPECKKENGHVVEMTLRGCGRAALKARYYVNTDGPDCTFIPDNIGNLKKLRRLTVRHVSEKMSFLPESIGDLENLERLEVNHAQLKFLPESIGKLKKLEELILLGNKLESLPESLRNLKSLKSVLIYDNNITDFPDGIDKNIIKT